MRRKLINGFTFLLVLMLTMVLCQNKVYSMEYVTVPTERNEIISVVLPVVEERDLFSFFIDPLHIFYNTFGNSGGDITVEEDACLLFYNHDGSEYTLSSRSDSLDIINKSTVPVEVTITVKLEDADEITIMQNKEFENRDSCEMYLALVDNEGNEQPLSENGEVTVIVNLDRAPLDAYAYVPCDPVTGPAISRIPRSVPLTGYIYELCEDTGEYRYAYQSGEVAFDIYSFGLMGVCNDKGDWTSISSKPHVTVSWNVEPVFFEQSETGEETNEKRRDILRAPVLDDRGSMVER